MLDHPGALVSVMEKKSTEEKKTDLNTKRILFFVGLRNNNMQCESSGWGYGGWHFPKLYTTASETIVLNITIWTSWASSGEGNGTPLQYSCLENPMDGGAWQAAVHGVTQSQTWLSDFTFPFHFHALEKEMATHSSVLTCRIPGTGDPGGLQSMGLHRVGHDWSDLATVAAELVLPTYFPDEVTEA